MAWKQLTSVEPGVTVWIDTNEIDMLQRIDPKSIKSEVLIMPNEDKEAITIVMTKGKNKAIVKESPEEILKTN